MAHTHTWCLFHVVFAVKERQDLIPEDVLTRLWAYIGGIARSEKITAFAIGGTTNHLHILMTIPPTMSLSKAVGMVKACSSKWLNEVIFRKRVFAWQEGYSAFSVGIRQLDAVKRYIETQQAHHAKVDYDAEWREFLTAHRMKPGPGET